MYYILKISISNDNIFRINLCIYVTSINIISLGCEIFFNVISSVYVIQLNHHDARLMPIFFLNLIEIIKIIVMLKRQKIA